MTPEMQKFIELLESQLGYAEKASGYTKFGEWYGKNVEFDADYSGAPWCEMYLSWAAHKLGYEEWVGQFAWTVAHAKWFKEQGAWGKKPKPGAFVYYDWSGSNDVDNIDHVGVVTRVEGDTIFTIEGNIDGGVAKRKERDTSKVVGYGYPEQIKARLDEDAAREAAEAQKKAEEQASLPPGPGTDVGVLQMPGETLTGLIPQTEREEAAKPPLAGRPEPKRTSAEKTQEAAPAPAATSSSAAAGKSVTKGKHAKPSTADTTSVTAEPLPTHADASATGPLPVIESPTLIGSALIAALALLAVAKTRQVRLRPATATADRPPRSGPAHRRRRRRGAPKPADAPLWTAQLRDPLEPAATPERPATAARAELAATAGQASEQVRRLLGSRPFDPVADVAPRRAAASDRRTTADTGPFTPAFDTGSFEAPLDTGPFEPCWETGPMRRIRDSDPFEAEFDSNRFEFTDETGPLPRIRDTGPFEPVHGAGPLVVDTGPFQRVVIPGATSAFDAFAPVASAVPGGDILNSPDVGTAAYRGRRRRQEPFVEERFAEERFAPFTTDLAPRGRRHRSAGSPPPFPGQGGRELVGAISATSTGRPRRGRHRA
ncbi:CHAP domain-containing protein [Nonomuraea polychroma]|uniref:CHAP domain-containing protein n=1 Tax=Nonomuraea polychroma TaxID=46176 RepID=A0A438LWP9_9ACTN|nr:CHAP domain-containing protein [Nonomuraea polychroma]RVX37930.1 CHAP domain-containing protein [Nonomuraea polychroma]